MISPLAASSLAATTRRLSVALAFLATGLFNVAAEPTAPSRPNIIVMLADDLGWAQLGCYGSPTARTPHLDRLAREGVLCRQGYVTSPVCAPSRAGLLTGRMQTRFGFEGNGHPRVGQGVHRLPEGERTLATVLREHGYLTGIVGKWHTSPDPLKEGFDEFVGLVGGMDTYWTAKTKRLKNLPPNPAPYVTDVYGNVGGEFIRRHAAAGRPFFLHWAPTAVHTPFEAPEELLALFPNLTGQQKAMHAMLASLDANVGKLLAALAEAKIEEQTLVFFVSDNGGVLPGDNGQLRGRKGEIYEGGLRVPLLIRWTGKIPPGQTFNPPVSTLDIFATSVAVAGLDASALQPTPEGVNLLPWLTGGEPPRARPHEPLCWRYGARVAARVGDWKVTRTEQSSAYSLYNLAADVSESNDRATAQPEKLQSILEVYRAWDRHNIPMLWPSDRPMTQEDIERFGIKPRMSTSGGAAGQP